MRAIRLTAIVSLLVLIPVSGVSAAGLSVRKEPAVTGTLALTEPPKCEQTRVAGQVLKSCAFSYEVDPAFDGDPAHDYGVSWQQVAYRPSPGSCARRVRGPLEFSGMRIDATAPARDRITNERSEPMRSRLTVRNAAGTELGTISRRWQPRSGTLVTKGRNEGSKATLRSSWKGKSRTTVGMVSGAALSWDSSAVLRLAAGAPSARAETC